MPLTLFVGRPGTGKTLALVGRLLEDRSLGRDVYANFLLGRRLYGYIVPTCPLVTDVHADDFVRTFADKTTHPVACLGATHVAHNPTSGHFVPWDARYEREQGGRKIRAGIGFLPDPNVTVLEEWEQVIAIRVARDAFGEGHRLVLTRNVVSEDDPDAEHAPRWVALPACKVFDCAGCSRGVSIGLDELNLWAPSRLWQDLGVDVLNRWAYIRKDALNIYASAQHEGRVDIVARQVTNDIFTCNVMGGWLRLGGHAIPLMLFTRQRWEPLMLTDSARRGGSEGAQHSSPMGVMDWEWCTWGSMRPAANSYDTFEHVRPSEHLVKKKGAGADARNVSAEQRTRIRAHLDGKHKRPAVTCFICQVEAVAGVAPEAEAAS